MARGGEMMQDTAIRRSPGWRSDARAGQLRTVEIIKKAWVSVSPRGLLSPENGQRPWTGSILRGLGATRLRFGDIALPGLLATRISYLAGKQNGFG